MRVLPAAGTAGASHLRHAGLHGRLSPPLRMLTNTIPRPLDLATAWGARRVTRYEEFPRVVPAVAALGIEPHTYQRIDCAYAVDRLNRGMGAYLGWEVGLGKTLGGAMVIDAFDANFNLIVCPNSAKAQWRRMLTGYCPWLDVVVIGNGAAARQSALEQARELASIDAPFALICHYEAVPLIEGANKRGWLSLGQWDLVVLDEAHQLKGRSAKRTAAIRRLKRAGVLMLSGSVMSGNPETLFVPLQILRPSKYRSKHRDWIAPYLQTVHNGFATEVVGVRPDRLEAMRAELGEVLVVRRAADHLDIPEPHVSNHDVLLHPEQRRVYDELARRLMAELPDGDIVSAIDGATLMSALRQVTGGAGFDRSAKHDRAMEIILNAADTQLLVFTWHKAPGRELVRLCEEAGVPAGLVNGDVSAVARERVVQDFKDGKVRVLCATLSTLGVAANLQNAGAVVFLEESYDPIDNEQAVGRVVRQGQQVHASVHWIRAEGTVDGRVLTKATTKQALRRLVLGA